MKPRTRERLIGLAAGIICTLVAMALIEIVGAAPSQQEGPITCMSADMRDRTKTLMLDGLDQSLRDRMAHLFEQWQIDDRDQPRRAATGMRKAIRAYSQTREFIERWNPPPCSPP